MGGYVLARRGRDGVYVPVSLFTEKIGLRKKNVKEIFDISSVPMFSDIPDVAYDD